MCTRDWGGAPFIHKTRVVAPKLESCKNFSYKTNRTLGERSESLPNTSQHQRREFFTIRGAPGIGAAHSISIVPNANNAHPLHPQNNPPIIEHSLLNVADCHTNQGNSDHPDIYRRARRATIALNKRTTNTQHNQTTPRTYIRQRTITLTTKHLEYGIPAVGWDIFLGTLSVPSARQDEAEKAPLRNM